MPKSPIEIIKQKEEAGVHYYFISTSRYGFFEFFIGIDPISNRVLFFDTSDLKDPVGIMTLTGTDDLITVPGIDKGVSNVVALAAYKAILKNDFPSSLSID